MSLPRGLIRQEARLILNDSRSSVMVRAGNLNTNGLNNAANNGNYWSSVANNATNAYNLNFNSGTNINPSNNNNRYNGQSVRCISR